MRMDKIISFKVDEETYEKLRLIAKHKHVTVSEAIREAIKRFLEGKHVVMV